MSEPTTIPGSTPKDAGQEDFVQMSALLTGFAADVIAPELDPVDLASTLFQAAWEGSEPSGGEKGNALGELLAQYAKLAGGKKVSDMTPEEREDVGNRLLGLDGDPQPARLADTARSVIRLWYLGSWYPVDDPSGAALSVVSDQAYIRGLAWKVMQSHAMGYSTWSYGYWAKEPPPLTDFTGNPAPAAPATATPAAREAAPGRLAAAAGTGRRARSAVGQGKGGQSPADLPDEPHAADAAARGEEAHGRGTESGETEGAS